MPKLLPAALLAAACAAAGPAADPPRRDVFKLVIASDATIRADGRDLPLKTDTTLTYAWERAGDARTLSAVRLAVKAGRDPTGGDGVTTTMTRDELVVTRDGRTQTKPAADAPDGLKELLGDTFGPPLAVTRVDAAGRELKREVVARPGAKELAGDIVVNARVMHPPFEPGKDEWAAPVGFATGYATIDGELRYKKVPGGKGGQKVAVSGTVAKDRLPIPSKRATLRDLKLVVAGEQTYDPARADWAGGRLTVAMQARIEVDGEPDTTMKGTMALVLERVAEKK